MPATSTPIGLIVAQHLIALGEQIRARRKSLKVSATTAAEAAGMSRVTLHRIEKGEPSVTMGAYLEAAHSVGLSVELIDPQAPKPAEEAVPATLLLDDYPQLKLLAWHLPDAREVTPQQALELYERGWRHVDRGRLEPQERRLIDALARQLGGGRLLV
ncbi:helix-turn-helix domain-containing protein [Xylophilus rhododendri]|uniref:Helix-turn-helix domain-containing protein n=1 Tax=Xylophilus rhododendri TaxID=2697032 RepID=A0A857J0M7_9BURK|nr:helix-turn-helix transcriptional regulator [Xylophilus rhododendri]QHI97147.1 helix-turn-helix domain-containing protein [Xylophilus rhododendri]